MTQLETSGFTHDTRECVATDQDAGERADVVLGRHIEGLSRRMARKFALEGRVRIEGQVAKPSTRVTAGQRLELRLPQQAKLEHELMVLRESEELLFVHKPPGLHTVALRPGERNCLSAMVVDAFPECGGASEDPLEGGALHRLDRATSGVVAFARSEAAWQRGRAAFTDGEVIKDYIARSAKPWPPALPEGALITWLDRAPAMDRPQGLVARPTEAGEECWRIRAALGPAQARGQVRVRMDGRRATTFADLLATLDDGSCVAHLQLNTGHRHQARVHMAWCGLALWGDDAYGGTAAPRLGLHAYALDLSQAFPGVEVVLDTHDLADWAGAGLAPSAPTPG